MALWLVCGDAELLDYPAGKGPGPCEGNGKTYTELYGFLGHDVVRYTFFRKYVGEDGQRKQEVIASTNGQDVPANRTYAVSYTYPSHDKDEQEVPDELPSTGSGGTAGGGLSVAVLVTVMSLLAVGGYAIPRSR